MRDDHSGYAWLSPTPAKNADEAAHTLIDWCAAFGAPSSFMSDSPTHFKNELLRLLARGLKCKHHFTHPYCPWINGAVERLGKGILWACRALMSDVQLRVDSWSDVLPMIQSIINHSPSPHQNNHTPVTAFTGLTPPPPVSTFIRSDTGIIVTIEDVHAERAVITANLIAHVADLNPIIHDAVTENRKRAREHSSKGLLPNFTEGITRFSRVKSYVFVEGNDVVLLRPTMILYLMLKTYDLGI